MSNTTFDLGTNSSVPLTVIETDANGAPVAGNKPVVTSSDESVVSITDNGDGTFTAVRVTQNAGSVLITATVTNDSGTVVSGTLSLSVGAILPPPVEVADVQIVPGTPS